ncbi:MAG: IS66 family transposase [Polaromonas sp.]
MNLVDLLAENKHLRADNERWRAEHQQLRREKAALEKRVARLEADVQALKELLETTQRRGKRQATPFSKGAPKAEPKKPGRKVGHPATHRPVPDQVDRTEEAPLPSACPDCGGQVVEEAIQTQYQIDIPRPIPVTVTQFNIHVGHCATCGQRLQGRHPEQTSDATGAAAVQIGPNALGLAADLKHEMGLPYGKTAKVLSTATELEVHRSTLARASQRLARKCQPTYAHLIFRLRQSEVAHVDETGWKIGGRSAWLWVFTNADVSLYVIDPSRAHEVVEGLLGTDYAGVLVSDCFLAYDPLTCAQSKCAGHLLRRCHELQEMKSGRAIQFSQDVARLLRAAITLKERRTHMSDHGYRVACGRLEAALDRLLARQLTDADNARFAKTLRKQRPRLFTFLYHDAVAPTNNAAERELRPAVVVRKTGGCNRTDAGAEAHAILASVLRTCQKQGFDPVAVLKQVLHSAETMILDLVAQPKRGALLPPAIAPP